MNILVTGGAGFIGSFLVDELVRLGHRVRIFDNLDPQVHPDSAPPDYLNPQAEFILGDMRDYDALKAAMSDIGIIFHEAAVVGLAQSLYEIKKYTDANIGGTANLLHLLVNEKHSVKKLIVPSSMSCYGEGLYNCSQCGLIHPSARSIEQMRQRQWEPLCPRCQSTLTPMPIREQDNLTGTFIYSLTKKAQEEMSLIIGKAYNIPVTVLRYFSVYGPRQSLGNPYTGVVAIFLSRLMNNQPPLIYEDGQQLRDYVSVHDVVQANLSVMDDRRSDYQVFNVGSGQPIRIIEIAQKLSQLTGKNIEPKIIEEFRKGDIRHCYPNVSLLQKTTDWRPNVSFAEGLQELIEWSKGQTAEDKFELANAELKKKGLL